jgi:hypothetical protein
MNRGIRKKWDGKKKEYPTDFNTIFGACFDSKDKNPEKSIW